jgi:hypothetical protein
MPLLYHQGGIWAFYIHPALTNPLAPEKTEVFQGHKGFCWAV